MADTGTPGPESIDMEEALKDPTRWFRTPGEVVDHPGLDRDQKLAILRRWEMDARELEVAEEENMAGGDASPLADVIAAIERVAGDHGHPGAGTKHG